MEESEKWFSLGGNVQEYKQWEKKLKLRLLKWKGKKNGGFGSGMGDVILIEGLIFYMGFRHLKVNLLGKWLCPCVCQVLMRQARVCKEWVKKLFIPRIKN